MRSHLSCLFDTGQSLLPVQTGSSSVRLCKVCKLEVCALEVLHSTPAKFCEVA